jgi:HEAT repeats
MTTSVLWLLYLCIGAVLVLAAMFVYLVAQKSIDNRRREKIAKRREILLPKVLDYLNTGTQSRLLDHLEETELVVLRQLLGEYNKLLQSEEQKERILQLARHKFTEPYRRLMHARRYSTRLNTLYAIEEFKIGSLQQEVVGRLRDPDLEPLERYQLYHILASLQDEHLFTYLTDPNIEPLPDFVYRELLLKMDDDLFEKLAERFNELYPELRNCVIDIIGSKQDFRFLGNLEGIIESPHKEERIRALKALTRIGYVRDTEQLIRKADAESWEERLMVARSMGATARDEYVPVLSRLMRDPSWWVRKESAQSLLRFPHGAQILKNIAETDEDRYARDMAQEWLEARNS